MLKSEKGVSAVEFALIAPLLFVLTFGIIEFGILLFDKAVVTNASREGARAAIVHHEVDNGDGTTSYDPVSKPQIEEVVDDYLGIDEVDNDGLLISIGGPSIPDTNVVYDPDPPESGGDVTVTVTYTYDFLVFPNLASLLGSGTFDGTIDLVGTTVMRME